MKYALILAAAAAACSSGEDDGNGNGTGGPAGDPSSAEELQALCAAQCARSSRCSGDAGVVGDAQQCNSTCDAELGTLAGRVRADAIAVFTDCLDALTCDVNDDDCLGEALVSVGANAQTPIVVQCQAKEDECQGTPGDFSDDICATLALLIESEKTAASRCLERPCTEVLSCLAPYGA